MCKSGVGGSDWLGVEIVVPLVRDLVLAGGVWGMGQVGHINSTIIIVGSDDPELKQGVVGTKTGEEMGLVALRGVARGVARGVLGKLIVGEGIVTIWGSVPVAVGDDDVDVGTK